ncbi:unnamed protein product [Penicillium palitans]
MWSTGLVSTTSLIIQRKLTSCDLIQSGSLQVNLHSSRLTLGSGGASIDTMEKNLLWPPDSSRFFTPDLIEISPKIDSALAETPTIEDGHHFKTSWEGIHAINGIIGPTGYAIVKRRTRSNKGDRLYVVVLRYDRGRRADTRLGFRKSPTLGPKPTIA